MSQLKNSRSLAFIRQHGRCYYCCMLMWQSDPSHLSKLGLKENQLRYLRCTAEHYRARQDGGSNAAANIVAACGQCNRLRHRRKQALSPNQMRDHVRRRVARGAWHPRWVYEKGFVFSHANTQKKSNAALAT